MDFHALHPLPYPYPPLPRSLINHTVSVSVKHCEKRKRKKTTAKRSVESMHGSLNLENYEEKR